jgi:serine/threonine-protein kinase
MPRELLDTVPVELESVTMKAMAKLPEQRYPDADDFRADLLRFLEGQPVQAEPLTGNDVTGVMGVVGATQPVGGGTQPVRRSAARRPEPGTETRRGKGWLALLVILLAALAVVAYLLVDTFAGGFALPDVVGKTVAQAEATLTAKGLVIGTTTNKTNTAATGTVLSTNPSAGTHVSKKSVVNLVVSAGEADVVVPQTVGFALDSAEALLANDGLNTKVKFVSTGGQAGVVLDQTPTSGAKVRRGSTVVLSLLTPTNQVQVPDLNGLTPTQAASALAGVGLSVGAQSQACSQSIPSGQVSGSNPSSPQQVARGTSVALIISSGPCQVVIEGVIGDSSSDASGVLTGQGLTVATTTTNVCDPSQNGNVVSQSPAAGTQVRLPATDNITVCSATSPTPPTLPTTTTTTTTFP